MSDDGLRKSQVDEISKKRKFVGKGVFYAELNDFLRTELEQEFTEAGYSIGYAGVIVRNTVTKLEVIIKATKTKHVVGEKGRRIRELTRLVEKRFKTKQDVALFVERVHHRALCALAQAEAVKFKLMDGLAVRRACHRALRFIIENEAKGCEIIVSGKLRGQRAKAMKFKQGYMITSGEATNHYIDEAVKHVKLRQGVLGIKVKIQLPYDPEGLMGPTKNLPDIVEIKEKKKAAWEEKDKSQLDTGYAQMDQGVYGDEQGQMGDVGVDEQYQDAGYPAVDPAVEYDMGGQPDETLGGGAPQPDPMQQQPYDPMGGQGAAPMPQQGGMPEYGQTPGGPSYGYQ